MGRCLEISFIVCRGITIVQSRAHQKVRSVPKHATHTAGATMGTYDWCIACASFDLVLCTKPRASHHPMPPLNCERR